MSKAREGLPSLMDQAIAGNSVRSVAADPGDLRAYSLRLPEAAMSRLKTHFAAKGVPLSTGIRMWLLERMKEEGV